MFSFLLSNFDDLSPGADFAALSVQRCIPSARPARCSGLLVESSAEEMRQHFLFLVMFFSGLLGACGLRASLLRSPQFLARRATSTATAAARSSSSSSSGSLFDWLAQKRASEERMAKNVETTQQRMNAIQAGRAHPSLLDRIFVEHLSTPRPLNQLARISSGGPLQLVIEPYDKGDTKAIERAISMSDLSLHQTTDGNTIRAKLPEVTQDRRKDLVKQAKELCEDGKVAVRNVRRDCLDRIRAVEKNKSISKDASRLYQEELQKLTDNFVKKLDAMLQAKEKDLLIV